MKDALAAAAEPAKLSEQQRAALQRFEQLYDEMAMEEIRDDTVASRPNDTAAWFRLAEVLSRSSAEDLARLDDQAAPTPRSTTKPAPSAAPRKTCGSSSLKR